MIPASSAESLWLLDEWAADPNCIDPRVEYYAPSLDARWVLHEAVVVYDRSTARTVADSVISHDLEQANERAIGLWMRLRQEEDARREAKSRIHRERYGQTQRFDVALIRRQLNNPWTVVRKLGLEKGARQQRDGVTIACPAPDHTDKTPSCSVRVGRDGTISVRCHGCGFTADVLGLIAAVHGLSVRKDFRRVCERALEVAA